MHDESGLKNSEQEGFLARRLPDDESSRPRTCASICGPRGCPIRSSRCASEVGVPFRITTKYWMEQMGLPFHPTHINQQNQFDRRHSYADLLRYPQRYKMHWRLWNGGTARVLLWGDPEYARRFAESTHLYDGDGFEVNEPLCTKMEAQPHDAKPFDLLTPPVPLLRLRVRALLAFLPGLRPRGLQSRHARRKSGSASLRGASARRPRRSSRRACTGRAGSCRASSPRAIRTAPSR